MNDHDFVCWLRGFMAGAHTPKVADWALVREQLAVVGPVVVTPGRIAPEQLFPSGVFNRPVP